MTMIQQNLDLVREYYTAQRGIGDTTETIYSIWEKGGRFNDSITPSTYIPEYRSHIVLKLLSLTGPGAGIFSLGCGNGAVEGELANLDRKVRAIDVNEEAVELTRQKGVDAFAADYFSLSPGDLVGANAIYADGLLGHLFDPDEGIVPALTKLASLTPESGTFVLFSNDAPMDGEVPYAPHERVAGFWFVSRTYLDEKLLSVGFLPVESYYFPYLRPVSGLRNRTVCIARVP